MQFSVIFYVNSLCEVLIDAWLMDHGDAGAFFER